MNAIIASHVLVSFFGLFVQLLRRRSCRYLAKDFSQRRVTGINVCHNGFLQLTQLVTLILFEQSQG